jgi:hypothetical protein
MMIYYAFCLIDSTITIGNPSVTGLTPTILSLTSTGATPTNVASHVGITEVGGGWYQLTYDVETFGEAVGVIDGGGALIVNTDRYIPLYITRDSNRITNGINSLGQTTLPPAETGESVSQTIALCRSVLCGDAIDLGGVATFKRADGTTTAVTITHDGAGNRSTSTVGTA